MTTPIDLKPLLEPLADRAREAGVFGEIQLTEGRLECAAANSAEPAFYRVDADAGKVWVSLVTDNRWLSESIESDLVHTGDKLDELIEEEMADLGYSGQRLPFEHYRSEDLLFTFRTPLPIALPIDGADAGALDLAALTLLGYEATFRQLGDMDETEEDD